MSIATRYLHAIAWLSLAPLASIAQQVKVIPHDKTLDVQIDGRPFTTYHFADDYFHAPVRPFFYPVIAADGTGITTDQQQTDPKHGYQRSIWVGHGDINGTNHWKFATPLARQAHLRFDYIHSDGFAEELEWTDKDGKPQMDETRTVRFRAWPDGARAIEITLAFHATHGDLAFGIHGDRGLLSVRLLPEIYSHPTFLSAEGTPVCEIKPAGKHGEDSAPSAAHEAPIHTAWCDESGTASGKLYGAAIFDDPGNPRHAPAWHATPDARLATDIFAPDHSRADSGVFNIPNGASATFRYSVVVHQGDGASASLPQKYKDFTANK